MNPKTLIPILPSPNRQSTLSPYATSGAHLVDPVTPACEAIAASESFGAPPVDTRQLLERLTAIVASVTSGDMKHPESMLVAQATALNVVFSRLTARAMKADNLELATPMLRLAFRAQAQCSRALQTLTSMRYPAIFARQLNIAHQQVVSNTPSFPLKDPEPVEGPHPSPPSSPSTASASHHNPPPTPPLPPPPPSEPAIPILAPALAPTPPFLPQAASCRSDLCPSVTSPPHLAALEPSNDLSPNASPPKITPTNHFTLNQQHTKLSSFSKTHTSR